MRRLRNAVFAATLGLSSVVFQSCPTNYLMDDCFGEDTISKSEYEDLNPLEQLLYKTNDCGRYEPVSSLLNDFL